MVSGRTMMLAAGALGGVVGLRALRAARAADLAGEVALVTGSSRGFGYLLAREFGRQGCKVVICARDEGELSRARAALEAEGLEVLAVTCDVSDQVQVERMVEQATAHFGRVDILVNNAGIIQVAPLESLSLEDFERALGVMYWGVVYSTLAVLPQMRARRSGRIVTVTSIGGRVSVPHLVPYSSAKFAATGFSEGLRAELADEGVTVTTILPGLMRTGSYLNALFGGDQSKEYVWFSLGATLPLLSLDAGSAARQVVAATRRGDAERVLGWPFALAARVKGVMPGLTSDIMGLVDTYVLPKAPSADSELASGHSAAEGVDSPLFHLLTTLGRRAARRNHEFPSARDPAEVDQTRRPAR